MLIALPTGTAQQRAAEIGCIEDGNGSWVPQGPPVPAGPAPLPAAAAEEIQPGGGIPWNQAVDYAWTAQRVCGPVTSLRNTYDGAFVNVGLDYPDSRRFTFIMWGFQLEPVASGATVCATGNIHLYEGVAQMELGSPTELEIWK